jgi:hypothetical protein
MSAFKLRPRFVDVKGAAMMFGQTGGYGKQMWAKSETRDFGNNELLSGAGRLSEPDDCRRGRQRRERCAVKHLLERAAARRNTT